MSILNTAYLYVLVLSMGPLGDYKYGVPLCYTVLGPFHLIPGQPLTQEMYGKIYVLFCTRNGRFLWAVILMIF